MPVNFLHTHTAASQDRSAYDRQLDRYVIRGVVGPDEFHTGYPDSPGAGIDNNAYTNVMTTWLLTRAIEVLDLLSEHRRTELTQTLGLTATEVERWEHISRRMFVPFHGHGIISQFEGYEKLEELDSEDYYARYGNIRRLDRILEAEGDSPNRYKVSKQADVLMLFYTAAARRTRHTAAPPGLHLAAGSRARHHQLLPDPHVQRLRAQHGGALLGTRPRQPGAGVRRVH
jgi:alpha,alpha-trehalase